MLELILTESHFFYNFIEENRLLHVETPGTHRPRRLRHEQHFVSVYFACLNKNHATAVALSDVAALLPVMLLDSRRKPRALAAKHLPIPRSSHFLHLPTFGPGSARSLTLRESNKKIRSSSQFCI